MNEQPRKIFVLAERMCKRDRANGGYHHGPYVIDQRAAQVQCQACGMLMNPIQCLVEYARQWEHIDWRMEEMRKLKAKLEEKQRCKCEHCGKFTKVKPT